MLAPGPLSVSGVLGGALVVLLGGLSGVDLPLSPSYKASGWEEAALEAAKLALASQRNCSDESECPPTKAAEPCVPVERAGDAVERLDLLAAVFAVGLLLGILLTRRPEAPPVAVAYEAVGRLQRKDCDLAPAFGTWVDQPPAAFATAPTERPRQALRRKPGRTNDASLLSALAAGELRR